MAIGDPEPMKSPVDPTAFFYMNRTIHFAFMSLFISTVLITGFAKPLEASGTIYIMTDGSVFPSTTGITSVDNITYAFTSNNYLPIIVQRDNVVIDGAGHTLRGTQVWNSKGIDLTGRTNVTVMNVEIEEFFFGIWLKGCSHNRLSGNSITINKFGIWISYSSSNNVSTNTIMTNKDCNIYLEYSSNNSILGNDISANNKIWTSPINYSFFGIYLYHSSSNYIYQNNIVNSEYGIQISYSSSNSISGNGLKNNTYGVFVWESSDNAICGNNLTKNDFGIMFAISSGNTLYHNNIVGNAKQAHCINSTNVWDSGYPSGGNYWSDYKERYPDSSEMDGSGIYSTPYVIDENNQDNYPLTNPWVFRREALKPPEEFSILMRLWSWVIVVAAISVLAGAIYFLKKGRQCGIHHRTH